MVCVYAFIQIDFCVVEIKSKLFSKTFEFVKRQILG